MAFDPWLAVMDAENVWDSPAQAYVMAQIGKHAFVVDGELVAEVTRGKLGRLMGVNKRYVKRVLEELEFQKLAIQPIGSESAGRKGRYVLTLDRCLAKVRLDYGVPSNYPLTEFYKLTSRSEAFPRGTGRRRKDRKTSRGDPGITPPDFHRDDPGITPAELFNSSSTVEGDPWITGGGSRDHGGDDPGITGGVIPGSSLPREESKDSYKDSQDAAPASRAPRLPLWGALHQKTVDQMVKVQRQESKSALYRRVANRARQCLDDAALGTEMNNGVAIATREDLEFATKALCRRGRLIGYEAEWEAACASEWFKWTTLRAQGTA